MGILGGHVQAATGHAAQADAAAIAAITAIAAQIHGGGAQVPRTDQNRLHGIDVVAVADVVGNRNDVAQAQFRPWVVVAAVGGDRIGYHAAALAATTTNALGHHATGAVALCHHQAPSDHGNGTTVAAITALAALFAEHAADPQPAIEIEVGW